MSLFSQCPVWEFQRRLWIGPPTSVYKEGIDQWLLAVTSDPAAKGSAKDPEVAGAGLAHCHFSLPPSFLPCVVANVVFHVF